MNGSEAGFNLAFGAIGNLTDEVGRWRIRIVDKSLDREVILGSEEELRKCHDDDIETDVSLKGDQFLKKMECSDIFKTHQIVTNSSMHEMRYVELDFLQCDEE